MLARVLFSLTQGTGGERRLSICDMRRGNRLVNGHEPLICVSRRGGVRFIYRVLCKQIDDAI